MKLRSVLALSVLLVTCMGAKSRDDGYTIVWKPKQGQAIAYEVSAQMTVADDKVEFDSDVDVKITKVAANGDYTVETKYGNFRVIQNGKEERAPDGAMDTKPDVEIFNAKGEKIGGDPDDNDGEVDDMTRLLRSVGDFSPPEKPVKKGDKWTEDIKYDEKTKTKAAKLDFEVLGTDKIGRYDVLTISKSYKETEGSAPPAYEGTMSFDVTDMSLVEVEAGLRGVPLADGITADVKVKMKRK